MTSEKLELGEYTELGLSTVSATSYVLWATPLSATLPLLYSCWRAGVTGDGPDECVSEMPILSVHPLFQHLTQLEVISLPPPHLVYSSHARSMRTGMRANACRRDRRRA